MEPNEEITVRRLWTQEDIDAYYKKMSDDLDRIYKQAESQAKNMTREEARIFLLEKALIQSHHTIKFLHGCLIDPIGHKYAYPDQTMDRLKAIEELVTIPSGCCHSMTKPECPSCIESVRSSAFRSKALEFFPELKKEWER
jgi:hypothetical protein